MSRLHRFPLLASCLLSACSSRGIPQPVVAPPKPAPSPAALGERDQLADFINRDRGPSQNIGPLLTARARLKQLDDDVAAKLACPDDVRAVHDVLDAWIRACAVCGSDPNAICADAKTGEALCDGRPFPKKVEVGRSLLVRVVGDQKEDQPDLIDIDMQTFMSPNALTAPAPSTGTAAPPAKAAPVAPAAKACPALPDAPVYATVQSKTLVVPSQPRLRQITITVRNSGPKPAVASAHTVAVDQGLYFLEAGFLMPFVPHGSRTVALGPFPGTGGQQTINVTENLRATPAVVLNAFPFGRRSGKYSPFEDAEVRTLTDLFGLQAGIGLDFSAPPAFYAGLVIEPITGLSFNVGGTVLQGQFVPVNYAAGMVLPKGEMFTPDQKYMTRFYFGITGTTEIVTVLSGAFAAKDNFHF